MFKTLTPQKEEDQNLKLQTTRFIFWFQLDDSKSLHWKWLFNQTSNEKWLFKVPGMTDVFLGKWGLLMLIGNKNAGLMREVEGIEFLLGIMGI